MSKFISFENFISKEKKSLISGPFGSNISSQFFVESGVPVIRGNNLNSDCKKFVDNGFVFITKEKADKLSCDALVDDIVFTAVGTLGQVGLITRDLKYSRYTISNKQIRARLDKKKIDIGFAYLILNSRFVRNQLIRGNTGSTVPLINLSTIRNILIPEFDLSTQQKIASVLSALDDKIELNNKINAELEAMAKTLYDYWFVQFDFPNSSTSSGQAGKPYKSSGGEMVYDEVLKREIPKGWEVKSLSVIESKIITGKTPSTQNNENFGGNVPFICIGDVRGNMHIIKTETTLSKKGADSQANKYIPKGSICVTCIASPGLVGFATQDSQTNQQLNSIVCQDWENKNFLYFYLKDYFKYSKAKTGNTFANMNKEDFSSIPVIKAPKSVLLEFNIALDSTINKILNNAQQNQELASLRDWLLPMLMNGQVKVTGVESIINEDLEMVAEPKFNYEKGESK